MYRGQCLCGNMQFEFESKPTYVSMCHCSICRRITGTAFATYVEVADIELTLTSGDDQLSTFEVSDASSIQLCKSCGSTVFARHSDFPEFTYVGLGTLCQPTDIRPVVHEYVGSKADWFEILDSLPRYERSATPE